MSQEQQHLRFSVEESVWFQKGQEVSELLSISLEPDISIHEHDQYISIRGALQLTGEYKIDKEVNDVQDQFEYANVRYVNEVNTRDDGISILNHRFPVDISIPNNRIENLEEVYVAIESFDYEIPELKCLKLIADLSISGISNEQLRPASAPVVEKQEEETFETHYRAPQSESFENRNESSSQLQAASAPVVEKQEEETFEAHYRAAQSESFENENESSSQLQPASMPEVEKLEEETFEALYRAPQSESELFENENEPSLQFQRSSTNPFSSFYQESESAEEDVDKLSTDNTSVEPEVREEEKVVEELSTPSLDEVNEVNNEIQQDNIYDPFVVEVRKEEQETVEPKEVQYSFFSKSEDLVSNEIQENTEIESEREDNDPKDAHYLTSLFARDEDEDFSRLKMCIVQQGETIEHICERYDISVQQILRVNDFHADQDVHEGQILYIPAYSTSK